MNFIINPPNVTNIALRIIDIITGFQKDWYSDTEVLVGSYAVRAVNLIISTIAIGFLWQNSMKVSAWLFALIPVILLIPVIILIIKNRAGPALLSKKYDTIKG